MPHNLSSLGTKLSAAALSVVLLLGCGFFIFIQFFLKEDLRDLRIRELTAVVQQKSAYVSGLLSERARLASSLAQVGESMHRIRQLRPNQFTAKEWEAIFADYLNREFNRFPEVVGGGIWYEPFRFDPQLKYRGYYSQWIPPVGKERNVEFTMEWSAESANYHMQNWYTTLIPNSHDRSMRLPSDVAWTAPYKDPVTGVDMITVDFAMYDDAGHVLGMSTVDWNLNQIALEVERTQPTANSRAYLRYIPTNTFIAFAGNTDDSIKHALTKMLQTKVPVSSAERELFKDFTISGKRFHFFEQYITAGIALGLLVPDLDIFPEVERTMRGYAFLILAATALAGIGVFLATRQLNRLMRSQDEMLTRLQSAHDEVVMAAKAKDQFLANMSHEIRTPLNGVLGMTEYLLDTPINAEQRECLKLAHQSAKGLLDIINDILDFSRIASGKLKLTPTSVDLQSCLQHVIGLMDFQATRKQLQLVSSISEDVPRFVIVDEARLRQVLINLIANAIKFTPQHGGITVQVTSYSVDETHECVQFSVSDTGIGIPEDRIKSIFDPFEQADGSISRRYGGTGLGLSISQSIVKLMGGAIQCSSRLGIGSTFAFSIIVERDESLLQISSPSLCAALSDQPVLILADTCAHGEALSMVFRRWRMNPAIAEDFAHIPQRLSQPPFKDAQGAWLVINLFDFTPERAAQVKQVVYQCRDAIHIALIVGPDMAESPLLTEIRDLVHAVLVRPITHSTLLDQLIISLADHGSSTGNDQQHKSSDTSARTGTRILVAEDNLVNQELVRRVLNREGFTVRIVNNGSEVLQVLDRESFNLILMDVQMPELNGEEATRLIRASGKPYANIPIVALTAHAMMGDRERFRQCGMNEFVSKPFNAKELLAAISRLMTP